MGAYKDMNSTWYVQFRFTNWKSESDRKTKRGFATKKEALEWERDFLTQSAGSLEMTFRREGQCERKPSWFPFTFNKGRFWQADRTVCKDASQPKILVVMLNPLHPCR